MARILSAPCRMMQLGVIVGFFSVVVVAQTTKPSRWDQQRIKDYPIYSLLVKARSAGAGVPETTQWMLAKERGEKFTDQDRETKLLQLLKDYPNSDYADDALLLYARCKFLYHDDAEGAIKGLYEVIQKYPKTSHSTWIAEDPLFLERAMISNVQKDGQPRDGWYGSMLSEEQVAAMPEGKSREDWKATLGHMHKEIAYFEYWTRSPNWTEDEARYWIAWIIVQANLKERLGEAEQVLKQVIESHRAELRTKADNDAARQVPNGDGITQYMDRTERKAHLLLIDLLLKEDKRDAAKASAADYARLHDGHPSINVLVTKGLVNR